MRSPPTTGRWAVKADVAGLTAALDRATAASPELAGELAEYRAALTELVALRVFEVEVLSRQDHRPRRKSVCGICEALAGVVEARGEDLDGWRHIRVIPSRARRHQ